MSRRPLHIALIGSRGVPNSYGGYETLMEELATRLVRTGMRVTVYCRRHLTPKGLTEFNGARLAVLPTVRTKHLDTPVHTLLSTLHATTQDFDAALVVKNDRLVGIFTMTDACHFLGDLLRSLFPRDHGDDAA